MPHKENFITDRIETILSLLDKSPGNVCHITPERDELLEHKKLFIDEKEEHRYDVLLSLKKNDQQTCEIDHNKLNKQIKV